jgi:hydrogenase 3 maturation protease
MGNAREFQKLEAWLSDARKVAVVGIGNTMRRDDAVGVEITKLLQGKVSSNVLLIEAETMPEDHIDKIVEFHPSHVLVLDSGLIRGKPGRVKLLASIENKPAISSHMLPLQVFCVYLKKALKAKIIMLIIQPKSTEMGEGLTSELTNATQKIAALLVRIL